MKRLLPILISWSILILGCSDSTKPTQTGSAPASAPSEAQNPASQTAPEVEVSQIAPKVDEPTVVAPQEDLAQKAPPPELNQINPIQQPDTQANSSAQAGGDTSAPIEQSASAADQGITQEIHQRILMDESLAADADKIKIVVINGHVTLQGVVDDEKAKNDIEMKAKGVEGVQQVDNQLEVKTKNQV